MRHRKRIVKLGRMSSHRKSMLSNMASSLISHKKIHTTVSKAHAVTPLVDKLITWSRKGTLKDRRLAYRILKDRTLVGKLFTEIAPVMKDRNGGYTRILRTGIRKGDSAPMAILELVGLEEVEKTPAKTKKSKKKESAK